MGQTVEAAAKPARQEAAEAKSKPVKKEVTTKENKKEKAKAEKQAEVKPETLEITVEEPVGYNPTLGQVPYKKAIYYIKENEISAILGEQPALLPPESMSLLQFKQLKEQEDKNSCITPNVNIYYE